MCVCAWLLGKVFFLCIAGAFLFVWGIFCLGLLHTFSLPLHTFPPCFRFLGAYVRKLTTTPPDRTHALFTLLVFYIPVFFFLSDA